MSFDDCQTYKRLEESPNTIGKVAGNACRPRSNARARESATETILESESATTKLSKGEKSALGGVRCMETQISGRHTRSGKPYLVQGGWEMKVRVLKSAPNVDSERLHLLHCMSLSAKTSQREIIIEAP